MHFAIIKVKEQSILILGDIQIFYHIRNVQVDPKNERQWSFNQSVKQSLRNQIHLRIWPLKWFHYMIQTQNSTTY